uniref:Uncharacterized protein n=1 Tax=Manihot esculenta TaxID=3983 RepID=A0A2C9UEN4_MANES
MRLSWACFCSLQLHSSPGSLLFLNSRLVCYSTKHLAEVCKFHVFLVVKGRIDLLGTKSNIARSTVVYMCEC